MKNFDEIERWLNGHDYSLRLVGNGTFYVCCSERKRFITAACIDYVVSMSGSQLISVGVLDCDNVIRALFTMID